MNGCLQQCPIACAAELLPGRPAWEDELKPISPSRADTITSRRHLTPSATSRKLCKILLRHDCAMSSSSSTVSLVDEAAPGPRRWGTRLTGGTSEQVEAARVATGRCGEVCLMRRTEASAPQRAYVAAHHGLRYEAVNAEVLLRRTGCLHVAVLRLVDQVEKTFHVRACMCSSPAVNCGSGPGGGRGDKFS